MDSSEDFREQLSALGDHLASRQEAVLRAWREAVQADHGVSAADALPRAQLDDHVPAILRALVENLRYGAAKDSAPSAGVSAAEDATRHGLQRWQQGYDLREVMREWRHLHLCLMDELAAYWDTHPDLDAAVMPIAWRALAEMCSTGASESTLEYFELQQAEAEGHVRDLEQTLERIRALDRRRTELFRQAAHDLRGNVGMVKNVTSGLTQLSLPQEMRDEFLQLLQESVSALHTMLDEVMDLARLQAGQELRELAELDAAELLHDLGESLRPLARERGLSVVMKGPESLRVQGDAIKIRRIAQNLLLNAIKYTRTGSVMIRWGDSRDNDPKRWMLCIEDTGPGVHVGPGAPLAEALQEATHESLRGEEPASCDSEPAVDAPPALPPRPAADLSPVHPERGEGIGLSIVKRLCELLDASIELESVPAEGTTVRIVLPRRYEVSAANDA